jgi:GntR family transcriptional regulator, rspAB operon transcriptional repressor
MPHNRIARAPTARGRLRRPARAERESGALGPIYDQAEAGAVPASLADRAYDEIKRRIIRLEYQPGTCLNEAKLSQQIEIGRTPVHTAVDRLVREGMLEVIPRKGTVVRPVSLDEMRAILESRLLVEPQAARLATERAREDEIERMQAICAEARIQAKTRETERLMLLDRSLHATIATATCNPVLARFLNSLHDRALRMWFISLRSPERGLRVADEHDVVVEKIAARDPAAAELAMRRHIESFADRLYDMRPDADES